jgi:hypothetical protein
VTRYSKLLSSRIHKSWSKPQHQSGRFHAKIQPSTADNVLLQRPDVQGRKLKSDPSEVSDGPLDLGSFSGPFEADDETRAVKECIAGQLDQCHEPVCINQYEKRTGSTSKTHPCLRSFP